MPDRGNTKSKRRRKSKNKNKNKNKNASSLQCSVGETETGSSSNIEDSSTRDVTEEDVLDLQTVCDDTLIKNENVPDKCCDKLIKTESCVCNNKNKDFVATKDEVCSLKEIVNNRFYRVESPDRLPEGKINNNLHKSKSLDDDGPINITEVTDDIELKSEISCTILNESNALIWEAESDVDWEVADEITDTVHTSIDSAQGILSIETISLENAECGQTASLSPEEEKKLRLYLQTLNLATGPEQEAGVVSGILPKKDLQSLTKIEKLDILKHKKARKNAENEQNILHFAPSCYRQRFLDVIDEEGSNESSEISRRHSTSVLDKTDYCDELEDDVFIDLKKPPPTPIEYFPLSKKRIIRNEELQKQMCFLVDTKIIDSNIDQSCGDWKIEKVNELRGAEIVYLDDSSSGTSEVYDTEGADADVETEDETVRIETPTIEFEVDSKDDISLTLSLLPNFGITDTCEVSSTDAIQKQNVLSNEDSSFCVIEPLSNNAEIERSSAVDGGVTSLQNNINYINSTNSNNINLQNGELKEIFTEEKIADVKTELDSTLKDLLVETDLENYDSNDFIREDSSSSICSSHSTSQSTAKYNPSNSSLVDIVTVLHDEARFAPSCENNDPTQIDINNITSDIIKQNFEYVTDDQIQENVAATKDFAELFQPNSLKDYCVKKIASLPFGSAILEELASVAESLNFLSVSHQVEYGPKILVKYNSLKKSPKIKMPIFSKTDINSTNYKNCNEKITQTQVLRKSPPPITPRQSSLFVTNEDSTWVGLATKSNPSVLAYLSPSQKHHIERSRKQPGSDEAGSLIDMHTKYLKRRGYHEYELNGMHSSDSKNKDDKTCVQAYRTNVNTQEAPAVGNRLLAIIQDSNMNNNIKSNSKIDNLIDKQFDSISKQDKIFEINNCSYSEEKSSEYSKKDNYTNKLEYSEHQSNEESYSSTEKDFDKKYCHKMDHISKKSDSVDKQKTSEVFHAKQESHFDDKLSFRKYSKTCDISKSREEIREKGEDLTLARLHRKREFILDDPFFAKNIQDDNRSSEKNPSFRRRSSLPRDLYDRQMQYIIQKEKEIEEEIKKLESEKTRSNEDVTKKITRKAPLMTEDEFLKESSIFDARKYFISRQGDVALMHANQEGPQGDKQRPRSVPTNSSKEEKFRQEMYSEYMDKVAEREERKLHKVIKISQPQTSGSSGGSLPILYDNTQKEIRQTCGMIEEEFITKAKERWEKLGFKDPETEDEREKSLNIKKDVYVESKSSERKKIKVIDGGEVKEMSGLPSHLREFVQFTANDTSSPETVMIAPTFKARAPSPAVWSPGGSTPAAETQFATSPSRPAESPGPPAPPPPPIWSPSSAEPSPQAQRKFRPVSFESPKLVRKVQQAESDSEAQVPRAPLLNGSSSSLGIHPPPPPPPLTASLDRRMPTSHSAPSTGLSTYSTTSRLPKAQNPTITLLQKAREGQLPRGAAYLSDSNSSDYRTRKSTNHRVEPGYSLRKGYASEGEGEESRHRRMADIGRSKIDGVGPTTKDGMPVALRSEVKDQSKWYKKMYDTIHKNKYDRDYVTVRYKTRRDRESSERSRTPRSSQYAYFDPKSGYLSEPSGGGWSDAYDSDAAAPRRRRTTSAQLDQQEVRNEYLPSNKYSTLASAKASKEVYKNQPGKIEDYVPGRSSVVEKESRQWWDEVMDIFDGQLSNSTLQPPSSREKKDITSSILSKSNMARALKESGYESDSTLVFRRRSPVEAPLSPDERRQAYRSLQAGGEPPLQGFRKPAPERPRESPRRYVESDVNIHYKVPVVQEPRPLVPEHELARRQAEHMKRVYQEERRRKYIQELQDMNNRRHADNFTPSQKSPIPLHRYDELDKYPADIPTKTLAKALYNFTGHNQKELTFKKGDVIVFRRQVDPNWYEGEINGRVGIFPKSYVESHRPAYAGVVSSVPRLGRARALFDFVAQTKLELPLKRGQLVALTRRIDKNWWEGRSQDGSMGIIPESYIEVLIEPLAATSPGYYATLDQSRGSFSDGSRPVGAPAAHSVVRGTGKQSLGVHHYTPQLNSPNLNTPSSNEPLTSRHMNSKQQRSPVLPRAAAYMNRKTPAQGYSGGIDLNNTQPLYVDTNAEAIPYRAMYKYRPQNSDELELLEGDVVYVLEKCDDGWYVGSSQRTGNFGTFPGNYVTKML